MKLNFKKPLAPQFAAVAQGAAILDLELALDDGFDVTLAQLQQALSFVSPTITTLNLRWDSLKLAKIVNFASAFKSIPPTVKILNFSWNNLYLFTSLELELIAKNIPDTVSDLDLSLNGWREDGDGLIHFLSHLSSSKVVKLHLDVNELGLLPITELIRALKEIPATVSFLSLKGNHLDALPQAHLEMVFASLSFKTIDLRGNYLESKTDKEWIRLLSKLPSSVESVIVGDTPQIQERIGRLFQQVKAGNVVALLDDSASLASSESITSLSSATIDASSSLSSLEAPLRSLAPLATVGLSFAKKYSKASSRLKTGFSANAQTSMSTLATPMGAKKYPDTLFSQSLTPFDAGMQKKVQREIDDEELIFTFDY